MLELKIKQGRRHVSIFDLPANMGRAAAAQELGDTIEGLMASLDDLSGDPDLENDMSDFESGGDDKGDPSYCEWHTLPAPTRKAGKLNGKPVDEWRGMILEDEEEDDAPEDCDPIEANGDEDDTQDSEDEVLTVRATRWLIPRPGCEISDPGEYDGGEHRLQCEKLPILELNDN